MIIRYLIYYIYIYYNYIEFLIFLLALRALWTAPITLWSSPKSVVSLRSLCGPLRSLWSLSDHSGSHCEDMMVQLRIHVSGSNLNY